MEIGRFVDQRRARVERFVVNHRDYLARQGVIVPTYRHRDGRRLGPYFRLSCRIGKRQVSIYLGADEQLIRFARDYLSRLQQARKVNMQMAKLRQRLRRQARLARLSLDAELKPLGLYRQGNEIRGWRAAETVKVAALLSMVPSTPDTGTSDSKP
jgi:hypothetical protein